MKILVLIPARGGSKRLPRKNIRLFGGKPLIVWSIEMAKSLHDICDIFVSTDDNEIVDISARAGALVPWLRPAALATDTASSVDVAIHALDWYEMTYGKVDGLLLLQPTSPLRQQETAQRGIDSFKDNGCKSVLGVLAAQNHPMWTFKIDGGELVPFISGDGVNMRSQDLPKAYVINGSFYLIAPDDLRQQRSFIGIHSIPLIMSEYESIDIDTECDWAEAEFILNERREIRNAAIDY